jgi:TadE-like protein
MLRVRPPAFVRRLHDDRRAAAMVEFIFVLVPLMSLFLSLIELSRYAIAQMLLQRAAGMAVRACAVIKDQPAHCEFDDAEPGADTTDFSAADQWIERAAAEGLRPWTDTNILLGTVDCRTQKPSGEDTLQIQAQFRCIVPIARDILCRRPTNPTDGATADMSVRAMTATARYAHQGASYDCDYANMQYALPGASGPIDLPNLGGAWP